MNGIGAWFRQLGQNITAGLGRFMAGRYGTDKLNMAILITGLVLCFISMFVDFAPVNLVLTLGSYGCAGWAVFRSLSRNTYARYQENRKFLQFFEKIKDRITGISIAPGAVRPPVFPGEKARSPLPAPSARSASSEKPEHHLPRKREIFYCGFYCGPGKKCI